MGTMLCVYAKGTCTSTRMGWLTYKCVCVCVCVRVCVRACVRACVHGFVPLIFLCPYIAQCSKEDVGSKLRRKLEDVPAVHISNPKTLEFQVTFDWSLFCSTGILFHRHILYSGCYRMHNLFIPYSTQGTCTRAYCQIT